MISGAAKIAGVIGFPVKHSLSPKLHNYWLETYGIDGAYIPLEVEPKNFSAVLQMLPKMGIKGCNVTVPHKEEAFRTVNKRTELADHIGAVNTVVVEENGSLTGDNTDAFGFIENIKQEAKDFSFKNIKAVVLGAGGACRAVLAGLLKEGVQEIVLTNRTREKAEVLQKHFGKRITLLDWEKRDMAVNEALLLVNTSTLGMQGNPPLEINLKQLPSKALVTDIVYKPLVTPLLEQATKQGNRVVDGLGMLLYQAVPGFEAWFGVKPEVTKELRHKILGV